jgi:hypothetical protein
MLETPPVLCRPNDLNISLDKTYLDSWVRLVVASSLAGACLATKTPSDFSWEAELRRPAGRRRNGTKLGLTQKPCSNRNAARPMQVRIAEVTNGSFDHA